MIKVGVVGAAGKMGQQVVSEVLADKELALVCAVDKFYVGKEITPNVVIKDDIKEALKESNPDIIVDFTQPSVVFENIKIYMDLKVKSVIGTTGLKKEQIEEIEKISKKQNTGILIAPNFSIGAILMMKFAKEASKYFDNAEIIEFHHNQKKDAPSGTAIKTAQLMIENNDNFKTGNCIETETIIGSRGGEFKENNKGNIQIHSVRMPGFVASQEVIFGADGQTLKIHHDTINRECYMSGVILAVKHLFKNNTFIYGLENIL
ncbi:MAG: 4-hydroxy-tetrahydrodipicolinate reductase [Candidatus Gastranaerophilales bacterium]|nr:4-hydroxy-tetrahydrodipicolinate reductase [Candidatus Gastranaerophilales bacterium]